LLDGPDIVSKGADMSRTRKHGVFCIEGDWWNDFNRTSTVKPVLDLLSQAGDGPVPVVHRDAGTFEELKFYCEKWVQGNTTRYPILYLAFHGEKNRIYVGDQRKKGASITLDKLADMIGSEASGRVVHFGSCSTLNIDRRNIQRFLKKTGVVAVTGFKEDVDWLYSSVFEVILLNILTRRAMDRRGAGAAKRRLEDEHSSMCKKLDFRMEIRED
jgi:hypothetical protein